MKGVIQQIIAESDRNNIHGVLAKAQTNLQPFTPTSPSTP
jgi:hypothetical protein